MKLVIILLGLACLASSLHLPGLLSRMQQAPLKEGAQEFIAGVHFGLGLHPNRTTINLITDTLFPSADVTWAMNLLANDRSADRIEGIESLHDNFYELAAGLGTHLKDDADFTTMANITLSRISDPMQFLQDMKTFSDKSGVNLWENFKKASAYTRRGDYASAGFEFGTVIQKLRNAHMTLDLALHRRPFKFSDPLDILSTALKGFAQAIGSTGPTDILECLRPSAQQWVDFVGKALDQATHLTPFNIDDFVKFVTDFVNTIPKDQLDCLAKCQDGVKWAKALGIYEEDPEELAKRVKKNAINHIFDVIKQVKAINKAWQGSQFQEAGSIAGDLAKMLVAK